MQPMIRHIRAPAGNRLRRTRRIGCRDSSIDHIVTVSSPTMHPRTSRIRPDMARTASSNSTKPRKSKDNGSTHDGETKVQPELDLEPEPLWKKILLAIPRAFGSGVRASPASANTIQPTVVMVCASCCSCSPYCSARPNGSASAVHSASCFTPSRPCAWSDERRAAGVARRRGLPTHAQFR